MEKPFSSRSTSGRFLTNTRYFISKPIKKIFFYFYGNGNFFGAVLLLLAVASFPACKDPDELGLEVLPVSDQLFVRYSDTATLVTQTIKEDSLLSKGVTYQLLGSCDEPVFGRSDAGFYSQVRLGFAADFGAPGDSLKPDSLILSLAYSGYYGDTTQMQTIHVERLTEDIQLDSNYYTSKVFSTVTPFEDLANGYTFSPKPKTSVTLATGTQPAQLRIQLDSTLADSILALDGQLIVADNSLWLKYFKGLYVHTEPITGNKVGAISYFDLSSPYSRMTLYFHNKTTGRDSLSYTFTLSNSTSINHQEHTYGITTDAGHQLIDSTYNDSLNYVQAMAGLKAKILFPYLEHFKDSGNIVVNKAELEITIQDGSADLYAPPPKLFLVYNDKTGGSFFLTDYFEGASHFGGSYDGKRTYKFNIARHLQKIFDGLIIDYGLNLLVSGAVVQANRVIIGSGKNPAYPVKLNINYTKLH